VSTCKKIEAALALLRQQKQACTEEFVENILSCEFCMYELDKYNAEFATIEESLKNLKLQYRLMK